MKIITLPMSIRMGDYYVEADAEVEYFIVDEDIEIKSINISTGSDITDLFDQESLIKLAEDIREGEIYAV